MRKEEKKLMSELQWIKSKAGTGTGSGTGTGTRNWLEIPPQACLGLPKFLLAWEIWSACSAVIITKVCTYPIYLSTVVPTCNKWRSRWGLDLAVSSVKCGCPSISQTSFEVRGPSSHMPPPTHLLAYKYPSNIVIYWSLTCLLTAWISWRFSSYICLSVRIIPRVLYTWCISKCPF